MASVIKPYNRAQNNYASGVSRTNEENIRVAAAKAGIPTKCAVKIVPVDTQGNVLTGATVTLNGTAGTVSAVGNIAYVTAWSTVAVKVELAGYLTQEFSIAVQNDDVLKEVTMEAQIGSAVVAKAPVHNVTPPRKNKPSVASVAAVPAEEQVATPEPESEVVAPEWVPEDFMPFDCVLKIDDSELSEGQANKDVVITISNTCPLSETGKARFPGCTDLASALKSLLVDGALELKSTNVVPGAEIVLKSPFRVSDIASTPESWGVTSEGDNPYSQAGLYAVAARTIIYFYLLDEDGEVAADDQYLCRLAYCADGFTRELAVPEDESEGIKQKANFLLSLDK